MFQRWTQCDACIFPVSDDRKGNAPAASPASPCYSLNREKTVFGPLWWVFSRMRAGTMNNSRVAGYTGGEEVSNQGSSSAHNAVCLFIRSRDRIRRPRTIEYICILIRASLEPPARLYVWRRRKKRRKKKFLSPVRDNFSFFRNATMTASSSSSSSSNVLEAEGVSRKEGFSLPSSSSPPDVIPLIIRT